MRSTSAVTNTALIIGGGDAGRGDSVEFWPNISRSSCHPVENLPYPMFGHSAAAIGSQVYACGGDDLPDYRHDCHVVDITVILLVIHGRISFVLRR